MARAGHTIGPWALRRGGVRRGLATIEAALVLPIFIMLAFGTVEYATYFNVRNKLENAARHGARAASANNATNATVISAIEGSLGSAGIVPSAYAVSLNPPNMTGLPSGMPISVTITATWDKVGVKVLPTALGGIGSSKQVRGEAVMTRD